MINSDNLKIDIDFDKDHARELDCYYGLGKLTEKTTDHSLSSEESFYSIYFHANLEKAFWDLAERFGWCTSSRHSYWYCRGEHYSAKTYHFARRNEHEDLIQRTTIHIITHSENDDKDINLKDFFSRASSQKQLMQKSQERTYR